MSARLFLYDAAEDQTAFLPFALTRPLGELRYGAFLLRERWSAALRAAHIAIPRPPYGNRR